MKNYSKILEILHDNFGWNLTDSLTTNGKKLVSDTLKANEMILNNETPMEITKQHKGVFRLLGLLIGFVLATIIAACLKLAFLMVK